MVQKVISYFKQRLRRKIEKEVTMLNALDRQTHSTTRKHLYTDNDVLSVL